MSINSGADKMVQYMHTMECYSSIKEHGWTHLQSRGWAQKTAIQSKASCKRKQASYNIIYIWNPENRKVDKLACQGEIENKLSDYQEVGERRWTGRLGLLYIPQCIKSFLMTQTEESAYSVGDSDSIPCIRKKILWEGNVKPPSILLWKFHGQRSCGL